MQEASGRRRQTKIATKRGSYRRSGQVSLHSQKVSVKPNSKPSRLSIAVGEYIVSFLPSDGFATRECAVARALPVVGGAGFCPTGGEGEEVRSCRLRSGCRGREARVTGGEPTPGLPRHRYIAALSAVVRYSTALATTARRSHQGGMRPLLVHLLVAKVDHVQDLLCRLLARPAAAISTDTS